MRNEAEDGFSQGRGLCSDPPQDHGGAGLDHEALSLAGAAPEDAAASVGQQRPPALQGQGISKFKI